MRTACFRQISCVAFTFFLYSGSFAQLKKDTTFTLYFEINRAVIDTTQSSRLLAFAAGINAVTSITGYADSTGPAMYNHMLSQKRAEAVYTFLKPHIRLDENAIRAMGEQSSEPELWQNRRVVITGVSTQFDETAKHLVDTAQNVELENVYFVPDHAIVTGESLPYIQQLANRLKHITGKFEIIGHINYQSRFDSSHLTDLYALSEQRAKVVYDYLVQYGVPAARLSYRGVGNSMPVYAEPLNDEQKRKNMRVQLIIKR